MKSMDVKIVQKEELKKLLDLYQYLFKEDIQAIKNDLKNTWNKIQGNPEHFLYFAVELNDIFVSSCNIAIIPNLTRQSRPFAVIENVITHPDYRRKGFGKKVVEKAIEYAKSKNCYKIMLLSNSKREIAHQFYKTIGFNNNEKIGFSLRLAKE